MKIKRYDIQGGDGYGVYPDVEKDGEWVKYEDIEYLVKDAMRYRWIKNNKNVVKGFSPFRCPSDSWLYLDETVDKEISLMDKQH